MADQKPTVFAGLYAYFWNAVTQLFEDKEIQCEQDGSLRITEAIDISGRSKGAPLTMTSASGAQSGALTGGVYDVWSDVTCYIKVGAVANDVTVANGYQLFAGNVLAVIVPDGQRIGGIVQTGTGILYFHRVK